MNIAATLVATSCSAALVRADDFLLDITPEPQEQTSWCWAAVSTMAAHSFDIEITVDAVAHHDDDGVIEVPTHAISQRDIVTLEDTGINTLDELDRRKSAFLNSTCRDAGNCNSGGETFLFDISGLKPPANRVITKARLIEEIHDLKKPVILKWDLSHVGDEAAAAAALPQSQHYVIITGFDPNTDKFRVFDPFRGAGGSKPGSVRWIPYDGYLNPGLRVGQGIVPMHTFEVFALTRGTGKVKKAKRGDAALMVQPPVQQIVLEPVSFDGLVGATDTIRHLVASRVVVTPDRGRITEPLTVGRVYPIVVITTSQLMNARNRPETLVVPRTSAIMATVIKAASGEIVDSIQLYHDRDGWKEAHNSDTQITELMEIVQANHPVRGNDPFHSYYLVSIPEQDEFFAAQGFGAAAMLTTLNDDARGNSVSAKEALGAVVKKVQVAMGNRN